GRVLFDVATAREAARRSGRDRDGVAGLGGIVLVPPVQAARGHAVLDRSPMFDRLSPPGGAWNDLREHQRDTSRRGNGLRPTLGPTGVSWDDGLEHECDAIIWCTGFRPHLGHLSGLGLTRENGHPATDGTRSIDHPGLQLLGYGDWTGFASATIIGAARTAKPAVAEIGARMAMT